MTSPMRLHDPPQPGLAGAGVEMDRFDQITTFVRAVELGGFSAAARDLGVALERGDQSRQALEQRLGARLLNRNTRHVKPTDVGEAYYKHCVDVLKRFEQADGLARVHAGKQRRAACCASTLDPGRRDPITPVERPTIGRSIPEASARMRPPRGREVDFIEEQFDVPIRHAHAVERKPDRSQADRLPHAVCASPKYFESLSQAGNAGRSRNRQLHHYTDSSQATAGRCFSSANAINIPAAICRPPAR